jgi:AcrR family transcriptional regulator
MFNSEASKGQRTRERIRETALRSFRERGYDETTVRLIAQEAGVSLGSTNYHFPSKNHLVQELYLDATGEFHTTASARMAASTDLVERLRIAYSAGIEVLEPYHAYAPGFLAAAVSPRSPINPLSGESEPALGEAVAVFREAIAGSTKHGIPADLVDKLPEALTVGYLLLALYWTYDRSPAHGNTQRLLDRALRLAVPALPLLRLPAIRRPVRELLKLVGEVRA